MSGVELIGLASSILQIADLGWKLSYKLYAFSKKIHEAGKIIELVSQDISATGAILKQLADEIYKDERASAESRLCSQGLIDSASKLIEECRSLFQDLERSIDGKDGNKVILGLKQKLKWSYLEPRVELIGKHLEKLKSSLALMVSVLVYAESVRSREDKAVLLERQNLVANFAFQKAEAEKIIARLERTVECDPESIAPIGRVSSAATAAHYSLSTTLGKRPQQQGGLLESLTSTTNAVSNVSLFQASAVTTPNADCGILSGPNNGGASFERGIPPVGNPVIQPSKLIGLEHQRVLIDKLLEEVNSSRYAVDHGVRYRLHNGVLDLHWREWEPLRSSHEDSTLQDILARSPVLARHWYECTLKQKTEATDIHQQKPIKVGLDNLIVDVGDAVQDPAGSRRLQSSGRDPSSQSLNDQMVFLDIQREMVDSRRNPEDSVAGRALQRELIEEMELIEEIERDMQTAMEQRYQHAQIQDILPRSMFWETFQTISTTAFLLLNPIITSVQQSVWQWQSLSSSRPSSVLGAAEDSNENQGSAEATQRPSSPVTQSIEPERVQDETNAAAIADSLLAQWTTVFLSPSAQ